MRRIRRRTLGVAVGLTLGWLAAGYAQGLLPGVASPSVASAQPHEPAAPSAEAGHAPAVHEAGKERPDEGVAAAEKLVPQEQDIPWFKPILFAILGLFVAALVLGSLALKIRGPLPPDPADTHDDHDDHAAGGHDPHAAHDHAHDHGHGQAGH